MDNIICQNVRIIDYDDKYKDSMFDCKIRANVALGKCACVREDMIDIHANYIARGEMFILAIDEMDNVVGMVGTKRENCGVYLKRLYVAPELK